MDVDPEQQLRAFGEYVADGHGNDFSSMSEMARAVRVPLSVITHRVSETSEIPSTPRPALTIVTDRTMNPPAGFTPLSLNPADWTLVAQPGTNPAIQLLGPLLETSGGYGLYYYTRQQFGDAAFWVEWRQLHAGDNSGVYVRTPGPGGANPLTQADALGHEIQIDDLGVGAPAGQGIHRTGAIYGLQAPTAFPAPPPGEWNTYLIETVGPKIRVTLNGVLVNDYTSTRQQNGFLALQVHSFPSKIQFRNLQVKGL